MRAIAFRNYGAPDVLEVMAMPRPTPKADQIVIRVAAAGVNPSDWLLREGRFKAFIRLRLPFIPGADVAGVVEEVGSAVGDFQKGDAVYAMIPTRFGGGYAEYVAVDAKWAGRMPSTLSFAEAAAVPLTALTALQALQSKAKLRAGEHILINGASGGVGTFAVQIAKALGARVTATSSARNIELVRSRSLGADQVIDYSAQPVTAARNAYHVVFDAVNKIKLRDGLPMLNAGGRFVSVNPILGNPIAQFAARRKGRGAYSVVVQPNVNDLKMITGWIEGRKVCPSIDRTYPLAQAAEAQRYSATERVRGKLVLLVDPALGS